MNKRTQSEKFLFLSVTETRACTRGSEEELVDRERAMSTPGFTMQEAGDHMDGYLNAIPCPDAETHEEKLLNMEFITNEGSTNDDEDSEGSPIFLEDVLLKNSSAWSPRPVLSRDCPVAPPDVRGDASPVQVPREGFQFTPAIFSASIATASTCPHTDSESQERLPVAEDKSGVMIASLAATARHTDILPLPEPIPDWRKARFHGFPVNYPEMNSHMYTEGRSAALKSIDARKSLVEFLRTSFASASATFEGVPAHARAPDPEASMPEIVDPDDRSAFHAFSSALLTGWLLHLTDIEFVDPVMSGGDGTDEGSPDWGQLSSLVPDIPLQYGTLVGGPADYVYDTFNGLSNRMYDALSTHFSEWSGWTMFDRLWNVCEPDPVVFTYNAIPYKYGFYSCSLTGVIIPEEPTTRDQVLYVYIPEDVGMDEDGEEVRMSDGIFMIYLDGYGGVKEKVNIVKYIQAAYDLGHMEAGSVSRFHEVFMKRYFPQGVTEDHDMQARLKAIDDAVGSCWGLTENYDGIRVIFDLFSRYVRAAWLIDHVMSAHNPTVKDGHWYYNSARVTSFRKDDPPASELSNGRQDEAVRPDAPREDRLPVPKKRKKEEEGEDDKFEYNDGNLFGSDYSSSSSSDTPIQVVTLPPKQNGGRPSATVSVLAQLIFNIRRDVQAARTLMSRSSFMVGALVEMESVSKSFDPSLAETINAMERVYGTIYTSGTSAPATPSCALWATDSIVDGTTVRP